jgi:tyrosine-protein phosphatase YwqE
VSTVTKEVKKMAEDKKIPQKVLPQEYGCEVLLEKATLDKIKDPSFPSDAYLIWYLEDSKINIDVIRGTQVHIFDMYYDKYGSGSVQKIDFGYGKSNPKLWGIKQPEKKKRR